MENAGMIKRLTDRFAWAKRLEEERGAAFIEVALCLPLMFVLAFGLIDFSQIIFDNQMLTSLTRQGSNLASRGWPLTDTGTEIGVVSALVAQGASLNIGTRGRIIVTEVANDSSGKPQIKGQQESPTGIRVASAVGSGVGKPATVPRTALTVLNAGQTLFVTEVFYSYAPMTPVGGFLKMKLTSTLYDVAYF
jgi:Flp pilus assembly protein TadG